MERVLKELNLFYIFINLVSIPEDMRYIKIYRYVYMNVFMYIERVITFFYT